MASGSGYSGGNRAYIPDDVNMSRAKVKRKNNDWSWEDEMLMYEVSKKESFKKQKLQEKEEMTDEMKALKKKNLPPYNPFLNCIERLYPFGKIG